MAYARLGAVALRALLKSLRTAKKGASKGKGTKEAISTGSLTQEELDELVRKVAEKKGVDDAITRRHKKIR